MRPPSGRRAGPLPAGVRGGVRVRRVDARVAAARHAGGRGAELLAVLEGGVARGAGPPRRQIDVDHRADGEAALGWRLAAAAAVIRAGGGDAALGWRLAAAATAAVVRADGEAATCGRRLAAAAAVITVVGVVLAVAVAGRRGMTLPFVLAATIRRPGCRDRTAPPPRSGRSCPPRSR